METNNILKSAEICKPMKDTDGNTIPGSGMDVRVMHKTYVRCLIAQAETCDQYTRRDTGKSIVHSFAIGYTSYSIRVEISKRAKVAVNFSFNNNNPCDFLTASDLWEGAM